MIEELELSEDDFEPGTLENPKEFGLLDTELDEWLGNTEGPLTYSTEKVARLMMQIVRIRLGWKWGRIAVVPYTSANRHVGEHQAVKTAVEAIDALESGRTM